MYITKERYYRNKFTGYNFEKILFLGVLGIVLAWVSFLSLILKG